MNNPVEQLRRFREQMGLGLSKRDQKRIFEGLGGYDNSSGTEHKLAIARSSIEDLLVSNWVKFIGVTGSVASGGVVDGDDIDLFIVVRNDRSWVYRLIIWYRDLFKTKSLKRVDQGARDRSQNSHTGEEVKDKLCINFICEERALMFDADLFTFHELMYMRPIYNSKYLFTILEENKWVKRYGATIPTVLNNPPDIGRSKLWIFLNDMAFLGQLLFMTLARHNPEYDRLIENHDLGKIVFYPKDFKKEVLDGFNQSD